MPKFLELVLKNLRRNRVRTLLTGLAVLILATIFSVVSHATAFIGELVDTAADTRLVIREKWITPSRIPDRYERLIAAIPGVEDFTVWHNYVGYLDQSHRIDRRGWGVATRMDNLREMHPGLDKLDPALLAEMKHERTGALVGEAMMKMMDWQVGQRFTMSSMNYAGKDLEFKIIGVLPGERWSHNFFFREDYFNEGTGDKDRFHMMWLKVADADTGKRVAAQIERTFDKSDTELLVETESKGVARLTERTRSIVAIVNVVVVILLIDMLLILSNSISISTRERRREIAIFKVLGFQPRYVMALVIVEAMIVGGIGGAIGGLLAFVVSSVDLPVKLPALLQVSVSAWAIPIDLVLGIVVGFLGSSLPAWNARNIRVTDVFSKIA